MYRVQLTATAAEMFRRLPPDIKQQIKNTLRQLYDTPFAGKALQNELGDLRSLKMKRYRAVYEVDDLHRMITVYAIGHRREIYDIVAALIAE
jgi:mRNA interferase RelE/StbE